MSLSGPPITGARSGLLTIGGDTPVHRLGFGAMRITGPGAWGPPSDRHEALAVLRRAVALGINFIDTAESYGPCVSEELIAEALHPYPAGLVIATKSGYDRPGRLEWRTNGRPERLLEGLNGSLKRLRLERIDLFQLHRIDPAVPADEQFAALREWQQEGRIRHIGLSEVTVDDIERAGRFCRVASVQNRYNLEDRQWEAVVDYCDRHEIAFIPWHPLGAGRVAARREVARVATRHGATPMQVAIAWLLQRSPMMLPIPGTSRTAHLEENVAAAAVRLSREDLEDLAA